MFKRASLVPLLLLSLTVRLGAWFWVVSKDTPLYADESLYLGLARAWGACVKSLLGGHWPAPALLETVYGYGVWPPLHPFLLSLGGLCGGLSGARLVLVLLSACTTLLVFKLARQCGFSRRIACAAAALHALYPESVAFSHYLWSETSFVFFLLAGLVCALAAADAVGGRREGWLACASGALFGCAGLCRATLLPVVLLLPLWWLAGAVPACRRDTNWRPVLRLLPRCALLLGMFFVVTAPWLMTLRLKEGEWKPFSTSGGYNLYLGNNDAIPEGVGSAWGSFIYQGGASARIAALVKAQTGARAGDSGLWVFAQDSACRAAAKAEIRRDPGAALKRVFQRALLLTGPDIFMPRHILNLIYRPMPVWVAALLLAAGVLAWGAVLLGLSAALWQTRKGEPFWLLLVLAGLLVLPALATISVSRMRFASTVLLFPVACAGLGSLLHAASQVLGWRPRCGALALFLAGSAASLFYLRLSLEHFVVPSAHYAPLIRALSHVGLVRPETYDTLSVRRLPNGPAAVGVGLEQAPGVSLIGQKGARRVKLSLPASGQPALLLLRAQSAEPFALSWFNPGTGQSASLPFVPGAFSCDWRETGLPGIQAAVRGVNYAKGDWKEAPGAP